MPRQHQLHREGFLSIICSFFSKFISPWTRFLIIFQLLSVALSSSLSEAASGQTSSNGCLTPRSIFGPYKVRPFTTPPLQNDFEGNSTSFYLIEFGAEWSGPNKFMSDFMEELAVELQGKIDFIYIDVDDYPQARDIYGVRVVPTFLLFKCDKLIERKIGPLSKKNLRNFLDSATQ